MTQIGTFVVLAVERLVARLFARWTRAIAAFAVTFVLATIAHLGTFEFARELGTTWHFFFLLTTSTTFEHHLAT